MAQKVKDAQSSDDDEQENSPTLVVQQNSILPACGGASCVQV